MTVLLIFTNNDSIRTEEIGDYRPFEEDDSDLESAITLGDLHIIFANDRQLRSVTETVQNELRHYNNYTLYIALHTSSQGGSIDEWKRAFPDAHIEAFSHLSGAGEFYHDILPKVADSSLREEDFKFFFALYEKPLNQLHEELSQIWSIENLKESTNIENINNQLAKKRDTTLNPLLR